ncbi:T9SS type A sorting domain-containing protein [bacterium]|nr:T9SS type A sorting domain-containing protein [bacterium]
MTPLINTRTAKTIIILLMGLLPSFTASSQGCLPEGITFTTQNQIDSFQINHPGCTEIEGPVIISGQDNIIQLEGLSGVTSIAGALNISNNYSLVSLTGLQNLASINGNLVIGQNSRLKSLTGLNNIDPGSIMDLYIFGNDSLSICAIESVCDYLYYPTGMFEIYGNAVGCNNPGEINEACDTLSIHDKSFRMEIAISPNPASTHITIESPSQGQVSIINLQGQELIRQKITEPKAMIDISTLPNGIYFVRVTGEKAVKIGKFIKQ